VAPKGKGYIYLPTKKEFYSPGKSNKAIFGNVDLTFRMLALRIDFSIRQFLYVSFESLEKYRYQNKTFLNT
jgi:hypothetical protein